jgi:hypothetical protein
MLWSMPFYSFIAFALSFRPSFFCFIVLFSFANNEINRYAVWLLRRMRSVLAPNGSSSSAPAIRVVGSGTGRGGLSAATVKPFQFSATSVVQVIELTKPLNPITPSPSRPTTV